MASDFHALDNRPLMFDEFEKKLHQTIYVSATPGAWELEQTQGEVVEQIIRPTGLLDPVIEVVPARNQVVHLLEEIATTVKLGNRILVTTLTKKLAEDLSNYFQEQKRENLNDNNHNLLPKYLYFSNDPQEAKYS